MVAAPRSTGVSSRSGIRVQTYGDVLDRFRNHPESKSAAPDGSPSDSGTVGLLARLETRVLTVFHIGKETNLLEQQEDGVLVEDPQAVYPGGGEWEEIRARLSDVPLRNLAEKSGVSERMLRDLRRGRRRPSARTLETIVEALGRMLDP